MSKRQKEIVVRPVHPDDAEAIYEIVSHPEVARSTLQLPSMQFSRTQAWMESRVPGKHRLVAELSRQVVGSASLNRSRRPRLDHSAKLGLMVHPNYWNRGVGFSLMEALIDLADNWLNLKRLELDVFVDNKAAIHLYEKFGFALEGTRRMAVYGVGRWHDEHVMARLRDTEQYSTAIMAAPHERKPSSEEQAAKVLIRPLHPDDLDDLHRLYRHPLVDRTTLQMPSIELLEVADRVKSQPDGLHRLVAELDDHVVGVSTLFQSQNPRLAHSAGLGMMVDPEQWGRRIGSQLLQALLELADDWLNLKRVDLQVNVDNLAAVRLYQRHGFVIEGTKRFHTYGDGRWADSYFMARLRQLTG